MKKPLYDWLGRALMILFIDPGGRGMTRALVLVLILCSTASARAAQDVTGFILAVQGVGTSVAHLCDDVCVGNEKKSWLESATFNEQGVLELELGLRSKHVPVAGVVLCDDTARITATARLDIASCAITDWRVSSNNDLYVIALAFFEDRIGREVQALEGKCREIFNR